MSQVAIIVLNWNNPDDTLACIASLKEALARSKAKAEIFVVDNASTDDSVARLSDIPGITLIRSAQNLGFSGGNNLGLQVALERGFEYALLLNNDTLVDDSFLDPLVEALERYPTAAAAGGKICFYPDTQRLWSAGGTIDWRWGRGIMVGSNELDRGQHDQAGEATFLTGCCLLLRLAATHQVGLLEEDYFLYLEDADYSVRLRRAGYSLRYVPASRIFHKVSATTGRSDAAYYFYNRNRWLFMRRHATHQQQVLFTALYLGSRLPIYAILVLQRRFGELRASLRALADAFRGRTGPR